MPGYKALPTFMTGQAADQVREAESRQRLGDSESAVALLEEALQASIARRAELPGWLCGRLAALYRTLGRYDDEVRLLERYRESQTSEEARTRYDARLSKARTIAERKRRPQSGALDSVRASLSRPRPRRAPTQRLMAVSNTPRASRATLEAVAAAIAASECDTDPALQSALSELSGELIVLGANVEALVAALQEACALPPVIALPAEQRSARYGTTLLRLLALFYEDETAQ